MVRSMGPDSIVADRFEAITAQCDESGRPSRLSQDDRVIWYIVATRCEIDMGGIESVFDQLLSEAEVRFLIGALASLGEDRLSAELASVYSSLVASSFYTQSMSCSELDADVRANLEAAAGSLSASNGLWALDSKLAVIIAGGP